MSYRRSWLPVGASHWFSVPIDEAGSVAAGWTPPPACPEHAGSKVVRNGRYGKTTVPGTPRRPVLRDLALALLATTLLAACSSSEPGQEGEVGSDLRSLESETLERGAVEVDGAAEAFEVEFTSMQPLEEGQRIRTLQVAILRTDEVLFDVRVEMAEEAWDGELARAVIDSVRLLDPPA